MLSDASEDDIAELRAEKRIKARKERCQCGEDWGTCPGVRNCLFSGQDETCPFSGDEQGEEEDEPQST